MESAQRTLDRKGWGGTDHQGLGGAYPLSAACAGASGTSSEVGQVGIGGHWVTRTTSGHEVKKLIGTGSPGGVLLADPRWRSSIPRHTPPAARPAWRHLLAVSLRPTAQVPHGGKTGFAYLRRAEVQAGARFGGSAGLSGSCSLLAGGMCGRFAPTRDLVRLEPGQESAPPVHAAGDLRQVGATASFCKPLKLYVAKRGAAEPPANTCRHGWDLVPI